MAQAQAPKGPNLLALRTVSQMVQEYPHLFPGEGSLRWKIFHAETNGFDACVVRMGHRVLLDTEALSGWLSTQG